MQVQLRQRVRLDAANSDVLATRHDSCNESDMHSIAKIGIHFLRKVADRRIKKTGMPIPLYALHAYSYVQVTLETVNVLSSAKGCMTLKRC